MRCPTCESVNPPGAKFCAMCGTALVAPRLIEGERKVATVLFADVADSTSLAERIDPEAWAEIMNGAFAFMNAAVTRYGGTVGRLMGDAILAFFGAPIAHEDDAERAVRAGLELRDAARAYARSLRAMYGLDFAVRVGINTGLTVLTIVGDEAKAEYTAMGDTANVAARLQSLARPDSVLIGADTYALVRHRFEVESRGEVAVKGKSAPLAIFEVLHAKATPSEARGLEGLRSPLVGRDAEVERLEAKLRALAAGRGGLVTLVGEAGLGKSRLAAELRARAAELGLRWLEGRGLSYAQAVLYYPWRQAILAAIDARESDAPEAVREKLEHELCTCCKRPGGDLPFLEAVLAVESEASLKSLGDLEGDALIAKIAEATQGYFCSLAQLKPTVLVFDDLHWADPATLELLFAVAETTRQYPLLLMCLLRPDKRAPSWALVERARPLVGVDYLDVWLEPLATAHARELLGHLLHIEDLPEGVRALMLKKSEGNPFFLEEVIRALIDSGHIVQEGGRWRARRDIAEVAIPDTLIGVLTARIDRLPEATRQVAQTAAVIGRSFAHRVLRAVSEGWIADLTPHLDVLTFEELVREQAREPELEYIFKHALTQEAAYERLLLRRRKELHHRTGEVLEQLYRERRDEIAPVLAHHFRLGEAWLPAARYAVRAAERALRLYALDEALEHYRAALEALERAPEAPPETVIDAIYGWTQAAVLRRWHEALPSRQEMLMRLERALALARTLDDKWRLAKVLVAKGNVLALSGFPGTGFEPLLEAFDLARELGDEHLVLLPYWAATEMMVARDPKGAAAQFAQVVALARKVKNKGIEAHALASQAMALARLGEFVRAKEAIERALALAPQSRSLIKEADVNILAGATFYDMGELERGLKHGWHGTQLALQTHGLECACGGYQTTGLGKLEAKRLDEALADLEQAIRLGTGTRMETTFHQVRAAQVLARFGPDHPQAVPELERALEHARAVGDDYGEGYILLALGAAHLARGETDVAATQLQTALASYRDKGMLPYVARTLRELAAVYEAQSRAAEAAAARAEADALAGQLWSHTDTRPPEVAG